MLRSNDVSNGAKCNRHATVTDVHVTQKAHGCHYINIVSTYEKEGKQMSFQQHVKELIAFGFLMSAQVDKQEKKKKKTGRAKRRMQYNRRFVNVVAGFGKRRGPNSNAP